MSKEEYKAKIIKNAFENLVPFNKSLGFELMEIREGYAKMKVAFRPEFIGDPRTQRWHGGVISAALDALGGAVGMMTLSSADDKLSTIDIRIDYMHGTRPVDLIADAELLRSGNRIISTRMRVWHEDEEDKILAEGKGVYSALRTAI